MNPSKLIGSIFTLFLALLVGCSGGDNNKDNTVDQEIIANVVLKSMESPSIDTYQAGQPISLDFVTETQLLETEHVGVTFILIERNKVAELETSDEPDGYVLGEHYIAKLQAGEQSHSAKLIIPNEELTAGDYVIAAYVDASGVIEDEAETSDNKSRGIESGDETTYASVSVVEGRFHDFILNKAKVGDGFAMFAGPGKRDTNGTGVPGQLHPDLIGFVKATKLGSTVNSADIRAKIIIGGIQYPAHLWDEVKQEYGEAMHIVFPDHEDSHFFPWDIAVNGTLLKAIHDNFDPQANKNTFSLEFTILDGSDHLEPNTDNNTLVLEVPYILYHDDVETDAASQQQNAKTSASSSALASSISKVGSWSATYGDSDVVAISPSFYSYMKSTSANNGYAAALAEGDLDLSLFDKDFSLLSASAFGNANVDDGEINYGVEFSVLGSTLLDKGDTITALDEYFGYNWSEEQKIVSATFTIVIVPLTVEAGVSGNLDIGASLSYSSSRLEVGGDIVSASLDAYATAEIDLAVASGGVGVDFLIISDTFNVTAYADLSKAISNSQITIGLDMTNDIEAISGEFYLYVKYPVYKWCCKIKKKTKTKTLYETDSLYDKYWTIINESATINY